MIDGYMIVIKLLYYLVIFCINNTNNQNKIIKFVIVNTMKYIKYPRTFHLPWSESLSSDDKKIKTLDSFINHHVIVTVKMDGQNCTLYDNFFHARSLNEKNHPSKEWIKSFHATIKHSIPSNYRIVVENMFAKHSIHYNNLLNYCYGLSVWENDICLNWVDTSNWFNQNNIPQPKILYDGIWNEQIIKSLYTPTVDDDECEGYVVRLKRHIHLSEFDRCFAKYVRKNHVQTNEHWSTSSIIKNNLK